MQIAINRVHTVSAKVPLSINHQLVVVMNAVSIFDSRPYLNTRIRVNSVTVSHSLKASDGFSPRAPTSVVGLRHSILPKTKSHDHPAFGHLDAKYDPQDVRG